MPGMNRNSRSIRLIETYLADLQSNANATPADALLVLDEIRRLERKWNEQVAAGSPRRIASDFRTMKGWLRGWLLAAKRIAAGQHDDALLRAIADIEVVASDVRSGPSGSGSRQEHPGDRSP